MAITIRAANAGDAGRIAGLIRELADSAGEESPITEVYAAKYLAAEGTGVRLAEDGGQAVGLISYSVRPNLFHAAPGGLIEELVVSPAARGRGIGRLLLEDLLQRLEAMGCAEAAISAMPDNARAQRLYRSCGLVDEAVLLERHF